MGLGTSPAPGRYMCIGSIFKGEGRGVLAKYFQGVLVRGTPPQKKKHPPNPQPSPHFTPTRPKIPKF
jgi:hypothetical protein